MTVAELIAQLMRLPADLPVQIVYDSAVCSCDIEQVRRWRPEAYDGDDKQVVGLFEKSSAWESEDSADKRFAK